MDGWQINISADNREFSDLYNLIGRSSEASEQLDQLDNPGATQTGAIYFISDGPGRMGH